MAFEKNVFNKTSRTDSKCPPLPCPELSDAHRHPLHLDTSVPVGHTYPQAIPFPYRFFFLSLSAVLLSLPLGSLHSPSLSNPHHTPPNIPRPLFPQKVSTTCMSPTSLELEQGVVCGGRGNQRLPLHWICGLLRMRQSPEVE